LVCCAVFATVLEGTREREGKPLLCMKGYAVVCMGRKESRPLLFRFQLQAEKAAFFVL